MTIKRRKLTLLDKLTIMVRQARCAKCGEPLGAITDCEFDHSHQLAMGGSDTLDNLFAKHRDCHKIKTKADAKARAKVRRIQKKLLTNILTNAIQRNSLERLHPGVGTKPKRKIQSRNNLRKKK